MKVFPILYATALVQLGWAAVLPARGTANEIAQRTRGPFSDTTSPQIDRRGATYDLDGLDDLEEQAEDVNKAAIYSSIDYLVKIFESTNIEYALLGGVAMQLYGMKERNTYDSDIVVSANPRDLLAAVQNDPNIQQPTLITAASGTARLFIQVNGMPVQSDVFTQTPSGQAPSMAGVAAIGGYNVVSIREICAQKLARDEGPDTADLIWLAENKAASVRAIADTLNLQQRAVFALKVAEENQDSLDSVESAFNVEPSELLD